MDRTKYLEYMYSQSRSAYEKNGHKHEASKHERSQLLNDYLLWLIQSHVVMLSAGVELTIITSNDLIYIHEQIINS